MMNVRFCNLVNIPDSKEMLMHPLAISSQEFDELCQKEGLEYCVWHSGQITNFKEFEDEYDYFKKELSSLPGYRKSKQLTFRGIFVVTDIEHQYSCYCNCNYDNRETNCRRWYLLGKKHIAKERKKINNIINKKKPFEDKIQENKLQIKELKLKLKQESEKQGKNDGVKLLEKLSDQKKELTAKIAKMTDWIKANRPSGQLYAKKMNEIEDVKRDLNIVTHQHRSLMRKVRVVKKVKVDKSVFQDQIMELRCKNHELKQSIDALDNEIRRIGSALNVPPEVIGYNIEETVNKKKRDREIAKQKREHERRNRNKIQVGRTFSQAVEKSKTSKQPTIIPTIVKSDRWEKFENMKITPRRTQKKETRKEQDDDQSPWSRGTKVISKRHDMKPHRSSSSLSSGRWR